MEPDATRRFSSRVQDYIRYRPSYPAAIIDLLRRECGLSAGAQVADIGSGTGLLAAMLLTEGCEVFGVEPNRAMREAGEEILAGEPRFHSLEGRAEATTLADATIDLVTAAQAFHWFDRDAAKQEFLRILRPPGHVALIWNERLVEGRFLEAYEDLLQQYSTDYAQVDHRRMDAGVMDSFFGPGNWREQGFPNEQLFDLEGLLGRLHSSSYAPPPGSPAYEPLNDGIVRIFTANQKGGKVAFGYETRVYYGALVSSPPR